MLSTTNKKFRRNYRLIFTSNGVRVIIRSIHVELYDLVKQRSDSGYNSVAYNQVKTALSESEAVQAKELNQLQSASASDSDNLLFTRL